MPSPFVFFDVRSTDVPRTRRFYAELFGWTVADTPAGIPMLMDEDLPWGGFTELAADDDRPAQWIPYVPVEDLDKATDQAKALGATVVRERTQLPGGALVVINDPTGATLVLWQADSE